MQLSVMLTETIEGNGYKPNNFSNLGNVYSFSLLLLIDRFANALPEIQTVLNNISKQPLSKR